MDFKFWPPLAIKWPILANSGQPELLAAKIFQVPWGSRCLRRVCDQAELSAMYGSRNMGTYPMKKR